MTVDRLTVARGAAFGALLGVPAAIANVVLAGQDPKPKAALNGTLVALLVSFAIAGYAGGRLAGTSPAAHGALAALLLVVVVQVIGVLGRLDRGADLAPVQMVVLAVLAAGLGAGAAGAGARRRSAP